MNETPASSVRGRSLQETTEDELFLEYLEAKEPEKTEIQTRLYPLMSKHAARLIWMVCQEDMPEVVDDAIIRVFRMAHNFRRESKFSTWYTRIVRNCLYTALAKRKRRREVGLDHVPEQAAPNKSDVKVLIEQLARDLNEEDRRLLEMKLQGEEQSLIAKHLRLSCEGVKKRWARLRKQLHLRM